MKPVKLQFLVAGVLMLMVSSASATSITDTVEPNDGWTTIRAGAYSSDKGGLTPQSGDEFWYSGFPDNNNFGTKKEFDATFTAGVLRVTYSIGDLDSNTWPGEIGSRLFIASDGEGNYGNMWLNRVEPTTKNRPTPGDGEWVTYTDTYIITPTSTDAAGNPVIGEKIGFVVIRNLSSGAGGQAFAFDGLTIETTPTIETTLVIDPDSENGTVGSHLVGANVIYSKDEGPDWEAKNKTDVLNRAGATHLRYPGGHVVSTWDWEFPYHGTYQDFWDPVYTNTLTEAKKADLMQQNQDRLSLDDFLDICRTNGIVPVIGINLLQGHKFNRNQDSIDKAVRLVNYVKDKITGPRYYYLDNEVGHQPDQNNHVPVSAYLPLIPAYSTAIKAADPQGRIVVNFINSGPNQAAIRDYGNHVDLIDHHWYYNNREYGQFWLEDWRTDPAMGLGTRMETLRKFNEWIETYNKPHIETGMLEWNLGPAGGGGGSTPGDAFYQGLVQADMLMVMIDHHVEMATVWPLTWPNNFRNLIDGPNHTVSPTLYIHRAFSKAIGGSILNLTGPATGGMLNILGVKSADGAFIDLYLLNKSTAAVDVNVELALPIVETLVMSYRQGTNSAPVDIREQRYEGEPLPSKLSLADTSFTHVRYRISGGSTGYELFADDFEASGDSGNIAAAPFPAGTWHQQGGLDWMEESSGSSVDVNNHNGTAGNEMRIGWGVDEVVTLYSTAVPIHTSQTYTFRGRWEIGAVVDVPRGFIAGIAEFSADDGSLVQRLTPDSLVFGNTIDPVAGEKGTFEVTLGAAELAAAGTAPGNRIGVFLHHDDGGDLYDDAHPLRNDVYYIDNVSLEVSGSITMLDQWMVSNRVAGAWADSDSDGVANQTEYLFGGNPAMDDAAAILPGFGMASDAGNDWMEYTYRRRSDPVLGLAYTVEASTNLVSGAWETDDVLTVGVGDVGSGIESVTNRVSIEGYPERFIRLRTE